MENNDGHLKANKATNQFLHPDKSERKFNSVKNESSWEDKENVVKDILNPF